MFDSLLDQTFIPDPGDYMDDVVFPEENRYERWKCGSMKPNLTLICFDFEGVGRKTSEYGFAWYNMSTRTSISPSPKGKEWWPHL